MAQKSIEVILMRQLASCLTTPVFIVDPEGSLIFFNEPAEEMLGRSFEETGEMPSAELAALFSGNAGSPGLPPAELPITRALRERRPTCGAVSITGQDNQRRQVEVSAIPLVGLGDRQLGVVAFVYVS